MFLEVFNWRERGKDTAANAEPVPGASTERMTVLAAELGLYLLAGSILEVSDSEGRAYNTSALLRARAIENQVYIKAPDQTGPHPASMYAYGHSMIVDPWGKVIAKASTEPGLILADIDLDYLEDVRRRVPALEDRRAF